MVVEGTEPIDEIRQCYSLHPRAVLKDWRGEMQQRYPALATHPEREYLWGMLQYTLYSRFLDQKSGLLALPSEVVAALAGRDARAWGFVAHEWITLFEEQLFPLHPQPWDRGRVRTIIPAIPREVLASWLDQCARKWRDPSAEWVSMVTGEVLGRRRREAMQLAHATYLDRLCDSPPDDHPAIELIDILNGSAQRVLRRHVRNHWQEMRAWAEALPTETELERHRKRYVVSLLNDIHELGVVLRYGTSEITPRLYAKGPNINSLPSELRKIALQDTTALDLRSAQLAVAARVYGCPQLTAFLERSLTGEGPGFWTEMLRYLGVGQEWKPLLKSALYAIVFCARREKVWKLVASGEHEDRSRCIRHLMEPLGLGEDAARCFMGHPLIRELLVQRQEMLRRVARDEGCTDAFGRWMEMPYVLKDGVLKPYPPTLLAAMAQSYEVRLMLSMLPIIKSEAGIEIVSFLHDGVSLHFSDRREKARQLRRIKEAVVEEARRLGVPTEFEEA